MKDIQSQHDTRRINIKKVGVKNISYPITALDKAHHHQNTVATVNMYVNLPHQFKGTHMSRFIEILNQFHGDINLRSFHLILEEMKEKLQAEEAHMEIEFPYFLKNHSARGIVGTNQYLCRMHGSLGKTDDLTIDIQVPIYPPLPSQFDETMPRSMGRWGIAELCVRLRHFIWIEDLITTVEQITSPLEGSGTIPCEEANGYLSVEGICKALGQKFADNPDISWFKITVKNLAQGLNTFATLEWPEPREATSIPLTSIL
ncbi:MAG: GTP cyclohydrolase I FolE2 [Proteobacteria bacterium]|nr:GTP cyclohydrolase I FolE2 [Pseudomonadota bacterium]MBU1688372.1 GTP cyclohydrolase I FolE2 [Pseudomonadota bacterium]